MGLFSNLLETYNVCNAATGITPIDEDENQSTGKTFLPLLHTTFKSQICLTLDASGNLLSITRDKKGQTIIIPCTEKSASRSSTTIAPHPLSDYITYMDKDLVPSKFKVYIKQLAQWKGDNPKLESVYSYLIFNSIVTAIKDAHLFKESEMDEKQEPLLEKISKIGIRFSVQIPGDLSPNLWEDKDIRELWINYLSGTTKKLESFDYLGGCELTSSTTLHPKKIISNSASANAKLISCNDKTGFTYRGRFTEQEEAAQIDSIASQKMHQTLKWLINNYGYQVDSQVVVVWAVDEKTEEKVKPYKNSFDIFCDMQDIQTETDILNQISAKIDANYAHKLVTALKGYNSNIKEHSKKIVLAVFDASTKGRLGITFYQEFPKDEYLVNISKWHEEASWYQVKQVQSENEKAKKGKEKKEKEKYIQYIGCPSYLDILTAAYGKPRSNKDETYAKLKKKIFKQLLECMFGNLSLPKSLVEAASTRASHPMSFTDDKGTFLEGSWQFSINTTCAITRKFIKQQKKEDVSMELEEQRSDRDYLYGRLLAIADSLEQKAMYKADKKDQRATNAVRLMSSFSCKPFSTWGILWNQLTPFINQLKGAGYYQLIVDSIMVLFRAGEFEDNRPLSPLYLLGYSAQMRVLRNKKDSEEDNKHVNIDEQN